MRCTSCHHPRMVRDGQERRCPRCEARRKANPPDYQMTLASRIRLIIYLIETV